MKHFSLYFVVMILLSSCGSQVINTDKAPSGHPNDVLDKSIYATLISENDSLGDFSRGVAVIVKNKKFGLVDFEGNIILENKYDSIGNLDHELRITKLHSKYGAISNVGEEMIKNEYDFIFPDNYQYISCKKDGKWGIVDSIGNEIIPCIYDLAFQFKPYDAIIVQKGKKFGICSIDNKTLIDFEYDVILDYNEGYALAVKNNKYGVINGDMKLTVECIYDKFPLVPNIGEYKKYFCFGKGQGISDYSNNNHARYGIIDVETGAEIIPFEYEELGNYNDTSLIVAKKDGKYGFINSKNEIIIPFMYDRAKDFFEGLAYVAQKKGSAQTILGMVPTLKSGFINKKGEVVIPLKFDDQFFGDPTFNNGLAVMGVGDDNVYATRFGYINKEGEYVIKPQFDKANPFKKGVAMVEKDKKVGIINTKGEFIIPMMYDETYKNMIEDSIITLYKDNRKFKFSLNGKPI